MTSKDNLKHSFSSIKDFQGCARRFQQVRILRRFKQAPTEATMYGERVHKAFEEFIRDGAPLPPELSQFKALVEPLAQMSGEKLCESKMGLRKDFSPCGFYDDDVWLRGIPDVLVLSPKGSVARVVDFKTGKSARFADSTQLELMAAMTMAHYPEVQMVKGMLLFVVAGEALKSEYTRAQLPEIFSKWAGYAHQIEKAIDADVWNPKPSGLCRFCPVSDSFCEYKRM
jgi:hypothetical protein